jgi:hypothetical protein
MCDNICFRKLGPQIAIDVLIFGIKYKAFNLRVRAICYIAIHLNQVINSPKAKWIEFKKENLSFGLTNYGN